jgi:hypothetical protein
MFFIVAFVHSLKRYLLEYVSIWIYSRCIPFAVWVLCVLFAQFVRMSMYCYYQFCYVCTTGCRFFHAARLVMLLSSLCVCVCNLWLQMKHMTYEKFETQSN